MSAVTGLSVAVDADAVYLLDGMIGYNTPAAVDLRLALVCPSGSTGHWGAFALASTSTAGIGSMEMIRQTSFGTGTYVVMGGSDTTDQLAAPHAYIDTGSTAGSVEFWFAQNSSSASATTIGSGSWGGPCPGPTPTAPPSPTSTPASTAPPSSQTPTRRP
jgi:hypothetical protein